MWLGTPDGLLNFSALEGLPIMQCELLYFAMASYRCRYYDVKDGAIVRFE